MSKVFLAFKISLVCTLLANILEGAKQVVMKARRANMGNEDQKSKSNMQATAGTTPEMSPGDQAPAGTPGTGENLCHKCGGSGRFQGKPCQECDGTGIITEGIGGGD